MNRARGWRGVADAVLAVALAAGGLAEVMTAGVGQTGSGHRLVGVVGVLAAAAILALRRSRPALLPGVFLVWLALGLVTIGTLPVLFWGALVPFWVALYSAARHGAGRTPWVTAGTAAVTLLLGGLVLPVLHSWNEALFDWTGCGLAFLVGWGLRRGEQRAVAAALVAERAEAERRDRPAAAVADERARIARELHDVLGHSVSSMVVQAGAAEQVVEEDPEFVRRALAAIRTTGADSLEEVRRAVDLLRMTEAEPGLAPQPGLSGLADLAASVSATGIAVSLDVAGDPTGLPAGLELAVYRIVQESLTNVRKHSGATRADVRVTCDRGAVRILVRDNGVDASSRRQHARLRAPAPAHAGAPAPGQAPGHGLIGMRERAHLYGGSLDAGPGPEGFAVRAVLPTGAPV